MIVSTSLAKVGHRQAPHAKKPIPPKEGWVFYLRPHVSTSPFISVSRRIYRLSIADLNGEAGRIQRGGSPRIVKS